MNKKLRTAYGLGKAGSILALITFIVGVVLVIGVIILYATGAANFEAIRDTVAQSRILSALNIPVSVVEGALFAGLFSSGMWLTRLVYVFLFALPSMILAFMGVRRINENRTKGAVYFLIAAGLMVPYLFIRSIFGFVSFGLLLSAGIIAIIPQRQDETYTNSRGSY